MDKGEIAGEGDEAKLEVLTEACQFSEIVYQALQYFNEISVVRKGSKLDIPESDTKTLSVSADNLHVPASHSKITSPLSPVDQRKLFDLFGGVSSLRKGVKIFLRKYKSQLKLEGERRFIDPSILLEVRKRSRSVGSRSPGSSKRNSSKNRFGELDLLSRIGINIFNTKPMLGVAYFLMCPNGLSSTRELVYFIEECPFLSKSKIGELFGTLSNEFCQNIFKEYLAHFNFEKIDLESALRLFQLYFKLPGESQKIHMILEAFANRYFVCNQNVSFVGDFKYKDVDSILVAAYALTMLNVDLHNSAIKNHMTKEQFVTNVQYVKSCASFPTPLLEKFYNGIAKAQFTTGKDNLSQLNQVKKLFHLRDTEFELDSRQFLGSIYADEVKSDILKRKVHKPRLFLLFNDCIICLKRPSNVQLALANFHYRFKGFFNLSNHNIRLLYDQSPHPTIQLVNTDHQTRRTYVINVEECYNNFLQYARLFSFESDLTKAVISKLKESTLKTISDTIANLTNFHNTCDALRKDIFGAYWGELVGVWHNTVLEV